MPKILKEKALLEKPIIPNRLLQPFLNESIAHILMNPLAEVKTNATEIKFLNYLEDKKKYEPDWTIRELEDKISLSELVKTCLEHHSFLDLPDLFPRFLCGLLAVYREQNTTSLPYTGSIFSRSSNAVKFLNDPENYPCHSMNMTDVVALVPGRIYSGCVKDTVSFSTKF